LIIVLARAAFGATEVPRNAWTLRMSGCGWITAVESQLRAV